ncbi:putative glutathione S-transferase [Coniochaeta ligniaria NRRL 30616]|uniref:glutathione transferase n=1 Tax=Coniochaeta ligniaria NRRL 30616 TaxID=1408157 RepID=A0A1J7J037_9PEZI|nr:putative glutathione S-transferase [Coniochaeta ligniaria NRRL 30616]
MAIKVYGSAASTCTKRVLTTLEEKNVPYELVPINFATGEHKTPDFLKKQPFGQMPVLEDDGFLVYESRAICKYVAKKYAGQGTKLIPDDGDLKAYGLFEQACYVEVCDFAGPAEALAGEKIFKPMFRGIPTDESKVSELAAQLESVLAVYDTILAKQAYLAGNEVSLADLYHLPYGKLAKDVGFASLFEKYPNVDKWFASLEKRESWTKVGLVGF